MVDRWHIDASHSRANTRVPYSEALGQLAQVLDDGARIWESFSIRVFGGVTRSPTEISAHHVHIQGCFDPVNSPSFTELLSDPPIWSGRVRAHDFQGTLDAWAEGATAAIEGVAVRVPILSDMSYAWLDATELPTYVSVRPLCGRDFEDARNWWVLSAGPLTTDNAGQQLQNDLLSGGRRVGIQNATDFLLQYLGRDVTRMSGPAMSIVLPGAFQGRVEWAGDDEVRLTVRARRAVGVRECWASVAADGWTLQHERFGRWEISGDDQYWESGSQDLSADDGAKIYVGRQSSPEMVLTLPTRSAPTKSPGRELLDALYGRSQRGSTSQVLSPAKFDAKSGQAFEGLVLKLFALADLPALDLGVEFQMPGIDLLALDKAEWRAYAVSVTLGHDIGKKARDLAGARSFVAERLPGWDLKSVVISAIPIGDLSQQEIAAAAAQSVSVIARENVEAVVDDPSQLHALLSS